VHGHNSYHQWSVPSVSKIAGPITSLTRKNVPFQWQETQEKAFVKLKHRMSKAPVIAHFDLRRETILQTNVLHFGWGYITSSGAHVTSLHRIVTHAGTPSYATIPIQHHSTPVTQHGTIQYHTTPAGTLNKFSHPVKPPLSQLAPPGTAWYHLVSHGQDRHCVWIWRVV
jgi:hypothetical protein